MPDDGEFPKTAREKQELTRRIAAGIIARIERAGLRTYEVRLVQNINKKGYFAPWRQAKVKQFGRIAYEALAIVKSHFAEAGKSVYMPAIVGSNGGFMLTETLPLLAHNPIDRGVLVDARAYAWMTILTFGALNGRLAIIDTAGDAPALPFNQVPIPVGMVANHDEAKKLKAFLPELRLFWVDAEGVDVFIAQHLATMRPSNPGIVAKEFDGRGYTPTSEMKAWDLLSELIDVQQTDLGPDPADGSRR